MYSHVTSIRTLCPPYRTFSSYPMGVMCYREVLLLACAPYVLILIVWRWNDSLR